MNDDLVKSLDAMTTANRLSTQANRTLPAAPTVPAIPARTGTGQPTPA